MRIPPIVLFALGLAGALRANSVPEPKLFDVVYWLNQDTNRLVDLERDVVAAKTRRKLVTRYKYQYELNGEKSPVRIASTRPTFVLRSLTTPTRYELAKFKLEKGKRLVLVGEGEIGYEKVPFSVAPLGSSYQLVLGKPLEVGGEYCFSPRGENDVFCFGVDEPLVPERRQEPAVSVEPAQAPLTNDDVVKMAGEGLSADVIVALIRTKPASFKIDAITVSELKRKGVDNSVILAMIEKR